MAKLSLYLDSGFRKNMLVYAEPGITFRALTMTNVLYGPNAVKFGGVALVDGKRVHYTAIAVAHPTFDRQRRLRRACKGLAATLNGASARARRCGPSRVI
jgi:hypothetical protein